jgi:acyl dehydratase
MNRDMVGFAYPPSEPYLVTEKSIQDFARALGDDNPAFFDAAVARELGHETICAPPTFPILVTMEAMKEAFADPALNMDFTRVVHGDQRFAYQRPIRVGDELVVTTHVDEIRSLGNNDAATFRTEITSHGEAVCTCWSKLIVRGEAQ